MKGAFKMKTIILYYSNHHGNTKKLVDAIAAADPENVELLDVTKAGPRNLSEYDRIGVASGSYAGSFGKPILNYMKDNLPPGKNVFILYSSAMNMDNQSSSARKAIEEKNCWVIGQYHCPGYNTFGPFKIVGGTAKGHPTQKDLDEAVKFYKSL